jgi:hypothetical protein
MLVVLLVSDVSVAEDKSSQGAVSYMPSLGDMMAVIQLRHSKLWYAARVKNWPLADYESEQINANLREATRFYTKTPALDVAGTDKPAALIGEAISAKDGVKFDMAFGQMTAACNSCHEAAGRAFIFVRVPTRFSPYSNQMFAPRAKHGQ